MEMIGGTDDRRCGTGGLPTADLAPALSSLRCRRWLIWASVPLGLLLVGGVLWGLQAYRMSNLQVRATAIVSRVRLEGLREGHTQRFRVSASLDAETLHAEKVIENWKDRRAYWAKTHPVVARLTQDGTLFVAVETADWHHGGADGLLYCSSQTWVPPEAGAWLCIDDFQPWPFVKLLKRIDGHWYVVRGFN